MAASYSHVVASETTVAEHILSMLDYEITHVVAGSVFPAQYWECEDVHILLEGWASCVFQLSNGKRQLLGLLSSGDVADLGTLYADTAVYGIRTFTDCRFALVSRSLLRNAIDSDAGLARSTLTALFSETQRLTERNLAFACQPATERVAALLCELGRRSLADRIGIGSGRVAFTVPLTQAEIANMLGFSSVHLNRLMQELRQDGLIQQVNKRIEILDWQRLQELAERRFTIKALEAA